jgi:hypothetical protein
VFTRSQRKDCIVKRLNRKINYIKGYKVLESKTATEETLIDMDVRSPQDTGLRMPSAIAGLKMKRQNFRTVSMSLSSVSDANGLSKCNSLKEDVHRKHFWDPKRSDTRLSYIYTVH